MRRALELTNQMGDGHLPVAGGMMDQTVSFIAVARVIRSMQADLDEQDRKRAQRNARASSRPR